MLSRPRNVCLLEEVDLVGVELHGCCSGGVVEMRGSSGAEDGRRHAMLVQDPGEGDPGRRQVALAWLLHKPGVTAPIVGATKLEHLDDAITAEQLSLSAEEIARLEEPYVPHAVSGHA